MVVLILTQLILFLYRSGFCQIDEDEQRIFDPGDIVIGGLFPIHNQVSNDTSDTCDQGSLSIQVLLESQAMIYAIEQINNSSFLSGVKIGYEIYDTCSDVTMALRASLKMMQVNTIDEEQGIKPDNTFNNTVKAVIGELSSEVSVAVARLFALPLMTQISYGSTSDLLSSRSKFPSFFRTVPSDKHQTRAIALLVQQFNFEPVGIVGSEDEYGKYGADSLSDYFTQYNICWEFKEILPADFSENNSRFNDIYEKLVSSRAEAIVLFTQESNAKIILEQSINAGVNRTWIASDAWSTSNNILGLDNLSKSGKILGVTCKRRKVPFFSEYMDQLINQRSMNASFFHHLLSMSPFCHTEKENQNCSSFATNPINHDGRQNCINKQCLMDFIKQYDSYEPYSVYMAVKIVAQGLKDLLQDSNSTCFPAWKLMERIKHINVLMENATYIAFNESEEINIGYDILQWTTEGQRNICTIGTYEQEHINLQINMPWRNTVTQFNCSKTCESGYELYQLSPNNTCCKGCRKCIENFISYDGKECKPCNDSRCTGPEEFLQWVDGFSITLAIFATIGLVVTLIVIGLFAVYSRTPIVRAAGGYLCFPTLFSFLGCFISVFFFLGMPTDTTCMIGLPLFSMSFTVCVSCILANLLQIFVGFAFKLKLGDWLKRVNKPAIVVMACASLQLLMCVLWLVLWPSRQKKTINNDKVLLSCNESTAMFVLTQVYIALLCISCFLFAYQGKRLPDLYKNAKFITVSMVIYLVVWILFIPIYTQEDGKYERAIEASAILVSAYCILVCHFAPKCYILVWKKELNDENKIVEYIRQHYGKKGITVLS